MMNDMSTAFLMEVRFLGKDQQNPALKQKRKSRKEMQYAIEVVLSDESRYTIYRTMKEIAYFHAKLVSTFPVEAGYFSEDDCCIPECPVKKGIFGPRRIVKDEKTFEKLLNMYVKEIPGLPASILKSELVKNLFSLRNTDFSLENTSGKKKGDKQKAKKQKKISITDESEIIPMKTQSYYAVAAYKDTKTRFSIPKEAVVQVLQRDSSGWWLVEVGPTNIGWAPATFLAPLDQKEEEQDQKEEKVGARYIAKSPYKAKRKDELSFAQGAIVKVLKQNMDGWWLVRYNRKEGFVPGSLFKKFDKRQATVYVRKIKRNYLSRGQTIKVTPTMKILQEEEEEQSESGPLLYQCTAVFESGPGSRDDEEEEEAGSSVVINKGDIVKVLEKKDHGWWYVEDKFGRGVWAPATHLKLIAGRESNSSRSQSFSPASKTDMVYWVKEPHLSNREDELSVRKWEKVVVVHASDEGWWTVKNMKTLKQGLVPSVCLAPLTDGGQTEEEEEGSGGGRDGREGGEEEGGEEGKGNLRNTNLNAEFGSSDELSCSSDPDDTDLDSCYVAVHDYVKRDSDELDVIEGQVVFVIDDSDEDLWYASVDGEEGWLPSRVLRLLTDEELGAVSRNPSPDMTRKNNVSRLRKTSAPENNFSNLLPPPSLPHGSNNNRRASTGVIVSSQHLDQLEAALATHAANTCTLTQNRNTDSTSSSSPKLAIEDSSIPAVAPRPAPRSNSPWSTSRSSMSSGSEASRSSPPAPSTHTELPSNSHVDAVTITFEEPSSATSNHTLEELEREMREAETQALEAQRKAEALRRKVNKLSTSPTHN